MFHLAVAGLCGCMGIANKHGRVGGTLLLAFAAALLFGIIVVAVGIG